MPKAKMKCANCCAGAAVPPDKPDISPSSPDPVGRMEPDHRRGLHIHVAVSSVALIVVVA